MSSQNMIGPSSIGSSAAAMCEVVRMPKQRRGLEFWENPKNRGEVGGTSSKRKTVLREDSGESEYDDESGEEGGRPRTFQRTIPTGFSVNAGASSGEGSDAESMPSLDHREQQRPIARVSAMRRSPSGASHTSDSTLSSTATRAAGATVTRVGVARHNRVDVGSIRAPALDRRQAPRPSALPRMNWVEDESGVMSSRLAPKSGACVPNSFA